MNRWFGIFLIFTALARPTEAGPPSTSAPNSLYLCTLCYPGSPGEYSVTPVDDYFNGQIEMYRATSGRMISVGSGSTDGKIVKRAKEAGMPIGRDVLGQETTLQSYRVSGTEDTKAQMGEKMISYLKQLDRTKPVTIHIADHGWNGTFGGQGKLPPEKSGIALKMQTSPYQQASELILTHEEFAELLKKAGLTGAGAPPVRIVTEHCYGGGIHWISEKLPNVCTAAFTSNEDVNQTSDNETTVFWKYVDQAKKSNRTVDMTEAFYAGWSSKSNVNSTGGALGSTQYVRGLLKKNGIDAKKMSENTLTNWTKWDELNDFKSAENTCAVTSLVAPLSAPEVAAIQKTMNTLLPDASTRPAQFTRALEAIQKTGAQDQKLLEQYESRLREARAAWGKLTLEQKAIQSREYTDSLGNFFTWLQNDFEDTKKEDLAATQTKGKNIEAEFLKYKKENYPRIQAYLKNRELLARMGELNKFAELVDSGKIKPAELKTYQRMMECESLPL